MVVGIIRASGGFVDGAYCTVGADGPGRRERKEVNNTHGRSQVSGSRGLKWEYNPGSSCSLDIKGQRCQLLKWLGHLKGTRQVARKPKVFCLSFVLDKYTLINFPSPLLLLSHSMPWKWRMGKNLKPHHTKLNHNSAPFSVLTNTFAQSYNAVCSSSTRNTVQKVFQAERFLRRKPRTPEKLLRWMLFFGSNTWQWLHTLLGIHCKHNIWVCAAHTGLTTLRDVQ